MKTIFNLLVTSAFIHASISFADDSPLSPALVLKPFQGLSVTNIEYSKIKIDARVDFVGSGSIEISPKIYETSAIQTFRYGLPYQYEIGVSQRYDNYGGLSEPAKGFQNPNFSLRKTWKTTPDIHINLYGIITPKTGDHNFRADPTIYDLAIEGVLKTPSGLITILGAGKQFVNSDAPFDSTSVYAGAYKEVGDYSLSLIGRIRSFESFPGGRDSIQTISAAIGKPIAENVWLQLIYRYVNEDFSSYQGSFGETINQSLIQNQFAASLRVLF